jgi:hypothetical protein
MLDGMAGQGRKGVVPMLAQPVGGVVPLFDEDESTLNIRLEVERALSDRLNRIAEHETELRRRKGLKGVITRLAVIREFLERAASEYERTEGLPPIDAEPTPKRRPKK